LVDVLTTVSRAHADVATEVLRLTCRPKTIPNFVDLDQYRPLPLPRPRDPALAPLLVHVSNFRRVKAPLDVVEIFRLLNERRRARLWMVGTGELWKETQARVRALGLEGRVRFLGLRTDLHRLLARTDLLVMASHYESFCLAALEAMACGVPVVAPAVGGLPELVAPPEGGTLFPPGDLDAAARAADALLEELSVRRASARLRAQLFGVPRAIDRYEEVYAEALQARATG
jgi:N-acetyl-alpha-D-glucosaminyl L-malate synthase BshA